VEISGISEIGKRKREMNDTEKERGHMKMRVWQNADDNK